MSEGALHCSWFFDTLCFILIHTHQQFRVFKAMPCSALANGADFVSKLRRRFLTVQQVPKKAEVSEPPIVFFDFDFTLTVVHVFKSLAGWVDAQVCMLAMRGLVVSEPHALTERGQLRRLSELGPAWIEQAFGGFSRVTAIRKLLDGLVSSGCRIILVTRGFVGVARKCLQEVGLLDPFEALYGNIGVAYGTRTAYDAETELNWSCKHEEIDRLWSLLGKWKEGEWDSKTEIVHRYQHQHALTREQAKMNKHGTCFALIVKCEVRNVPSTLFS